RLTEGGWPVDRVVHLDEARGWVYFLAGRASPTERHLYRVALAGGAPERLTPEAGFHDAVFARDGAWYALHHENRATPPRLTVHTRDGAERWHLHATPAADLLAELPPPEIVTLPARDGTPLYGAIYHPRLSAP